jgi:hypothetical protein
MFTEEYCQGQAGRLKGNESKYELRSPTYYSKIVADYVVG